MMDICKAVLTPSQCHANAVQTTTEPRPNAVQSKNNAVPTPSADSRVRTSAGAYAQNSIPFHSINNSIPFHSPLSPQGDAGAQKYILDADGHAMLNPEWQEGEEGRKEEIQTSPGGKGGREGKYPLDMTICRNRMTAAEQKKLRQEIGDELYLEIPEEVDEWAESKHIEIKEPYKMCLKFGRKAMKDGRSKGVASGQN